MADFSDEEDRQLVQLAAVYKQAGRRIDWVSVEKDMRPSTWSATKLQQRIKTLKRRYGNNVLSFPHAISARHPTEQDCIWKPKPRLLYGFRLHHIPFRSYHRKKPTTPLKDYSAYSPGVMCARVNVS
ncbi:hypothetical protein PR001_g16432 [Phytophthora rubi]|uniref:Uncharacterized protein n=1 Tax=Phytophthora rubi TaxID=129364 RepID=A0A6A3KQJ1_9STRA|nr:hypothetical protein PR001_g16432 [Phytophthora rubi]